MTAKAPVRILAEPPLFEEWLEREIGDRQVMLRSDGRHMSSEQWHFERGYLEALRAVRQELENGG